MATGMNAAMASMMNNPSMLAMMQQMMQGMNAGQGNMTGYANMQQPQMPAQNYNGFGQQMTGGYNVGQMMAQPTQPRTPGIFDLMSGLPGVFGTALSSDPILGPILAQSAGRPYVNSLADHPIMQTVVGNGVLAQAYQEMFGQKQQQGSYGYQQPLQNNYQQYPQQQAGVGGNPLLTASNPFVADMMQNQLKQQQAMLMQQQQQMMQQYQQQQMASNPYFAAANTTMNPFMAAALLGNQYYDPITKQSMTGTAGGVDDKNQAMMKLMLQQLMSGNLPASASNSTTKKPTTTTSTSKKPTTTASTKKPTTTKPATQTATKPAVDDLLAKINDLVAGLTEQLGA